MRRLSDAEVEAVMQEIKRQRNNKRSYGNLKEDFKNLAKKDKKFYEGLVELFQEKDAINDQRDDVENRAYLRFVPQSVGNELSEEQIKELAGKMMHIGFIEKDDAISTYSFQAREDGQVDIVSDMKKAIQGKANAKKAIINRAKQLKSIFQSKIDFAEREIEKIEEKIKMLMENRARASEQLTKLDSPRVTQESRNATTGENIIITNGDSEEEINAKKESLKKVIAEIDQQIGDYEKNVLNKKREIEIMRAEFSRVVSRIEEELRKKGMTLEQEENSSSVEARKSEDKKDEKDDKSNEGKTLTEKKRREQSVNKAKDIIYGINESLTKEEILEHIQEGRLDHFVEAKRKLYSSPAQMKIFDEKLRQILEKMALEDGIETIHMQGTNINIVKHRKLGKDKIRRHFR